MLSAETRRPRLICPHCLGNQLRPARCLSNAARIAANALSYAGCWLAQALLTIAWWLNVIRTLGLAALSEQPAVTHVPQFGLWRKCRLCGATALDGVEAAGRPACGNCGYNLSGNRSGTCPECGWQIPSMTRVLLHYEGKFGFHKLPRHPKV